MTIEAISAFIPDHSLTNQDLINKYNLASTNEWILERTGIVSRNICPEDVNACDMAIAAAKDLKIPDKSKIKYVIVATSTHAQAFPSIAIYVHQALELDTSATCFDINDACNGFVQAVTIAQNMLKDDEQAIVIGTDKMSQIVDWNDRSTSVIFGDGAGAMLISANTDKYLTTSYTLSQNTGELYADPLVSMNGPKVFKYAVSSIISDIQDILNKNHLSPQQIKYFIPHQANSRIIEAIKERLHVDNVVNVIANYGNTSAASIPIALTHVWDNLSSGDLILISGFAAGFRGGSAILCK
jgi:3-oxoacyl-[acyl-carrier-protein] synthase-3